MLTSDVKVVGAETERGSLWCSAAVRPAAEDAASVQQAVFGRSPRSARGTTARALHSITESGCLLNQLCGVRNCRQHGLARADLKHAMQVLEVLCQRADETKVITFSRALLDHALLCLQERPVRLVYYNRMLVRLCQLIQPVKLLCLLNMNRRCCISWTPT